MELLGSQGFICNLEGKVSEDGDIAAIIRKLKDLQCGKCAEDIATDLIAAQIIDEIELRSASQPSHDCLEDLVGCCAWLLKLQQQQRCHKFGKATFMRLSSCLLSLLVVIQQRCYMY